MRKQAAKVVIIYHLAIYYLQFFTFHSALFPLHSSFFQFFDLELKGFIAFHSLIISRKKIQNG